MTKQKTLAYVLKGYPRISETFISNEILLLEKEGFRLHLFSMRHPREKFCHPSVEEIQAQVTYLPSEFTGNWTKLLYPQITAFAAQPAGYLKTLFYTAKQFTKKRKVATIKHFLQAGFLTATIKRENLDVGHLHGHFAHSPTSVTLFASMMSGIPFSFTAHAKDIYTSSKASLQEKMQRADFLATCTGYNNTYLSEVKGNIPCPINTIYHGINLDLFKDITQKESATPPYKILTIARMTAKKGLPTLYRALAQLRDQGLEFSHTLIGDGDDREKTEKLLKELNLTDCCTLLGTKTHKDVLEEFLQADLFVLSSQIAKNGDRDGVPNVLVESLAMGVPALSTKVSAIPELLHHRETGYLVEPENVPDLVDGIRTMLTDTALRTTVMENGRNFVEQHFDNKVQTKKLGAVFHKQCPSLFPGKR